MIHYFLVALTLISLGMLSWVIKNIQLKQIQKVFRRYNEQKDLSILLDWIRQSNSTQRLARVLDYLIKIEDDSLAVAIFDEFGAQRFPHRHIQIFALKALMNQDREDALSLAESMRTRWPDDDSILELHLMTLIHFKRYPEARALLNHRMSLKFKGTIFLRFHSQLLAAEGKLAEAVASLEKVVERERMLYQNTFSAPNKRLIYDQYVASQILLDELNEQLHGPQKTSE